MPWNGRFQWGTKNRKAAEVFAPQIVDVIDHVLKQGSNLKGIREQLLDALGPDVGNAAAILVESGAVSALARRIKADPEKAATIASEMNKVAEKAAR